MASEPTPSEAVRVAVQECKRLAEEYVTASIVHAVSGDGGWERALNAFHEALDRLAALSLHVAPQQEIRPPGLRQYLDDVMHSGTPNEQTVARTALHLLGATPAGSGSTLQPPAGASAAIPGAEPTPGERAMVLLDLAMLELACLTGGDVAEEDRVRGQRTIERIVEFFKANPRPYHFAPEIKARRPQDDEAFDADDQDAP